MVRTAKFSAGPVKDRIAIGLSKFLTPQSQAVFLQVSVFRKLALVCFIVLFAVALSPPFMANARPKTYGPITEYLGAAVPILIVVSNENPFGDYYGEILRTEGLNLFRVVDIDALTVDVLSHYEVVILSEMTVTQDHVDLLTDWVSAGGNLLAMRPDSLLESLLGVHKWGGTLSDSYLAIDASGPGFGIVNETMQYHGGADLYNVSDAKVLATLFATAVISTSFPAVTLRHVGENGGEVATFAYDLARSIVYTRQGNPNWAGQERDGVTPIRSNDLYYGNASFDPQSDWVDFDKIDIPQADEQQRFLVNLILTMNADRKPLPRFWYFPRNLRAVVVMTGDDHGFGDIVERFERFKALSPPDCSVENWECVRSTAYLWHDQSHLDVVQAARYINEGFEIAMHVDTKCKDWTPASLRSDYSQQLGQFADKYPSIPPPVTHRLHCIAWSDWATQANVESDHGIRLDTNYYYYPPWTIKPGLFTGSGIPMRFADTDGQIINVFQAVTQMNDNHGQDYPATIDALLDKALGNEGFYGAFVANMHFGTGDFGAIHPGAEAIIHSAQSRGVPVVSARQMLEWIDSRNAAAFDAIEWRDRTLSFHVTAPEEARGLRIMVPYRFGDALVDAIYSNGVPIGHIVETIKGIEYVSFSGRTGDYVIGYAQDTVSPTIDDVETIVISENKALVTWQTDEYANATVLYGESPLTLENVTSRSSFVLEHRIELSGLKPGTLYYYRVISADVAGNQSLFPSLDHFTPLTFVTPTDSIYDDTVENFNAGDTAECAYIAQTSNGEVMLAPTIGAEFSGSQLPDNWSHELGTNGYLDVEGGLLILKRARTWTSASFLPGHTLEFVATFEPEPNQHIGLSNSPTFDPPQDWIIFSTAWRGDGVYARVGAGDMKFIGSGLLGSPHRYRIDWKAGEALFSVDDILVYRTQVTTEPERYVVVSNATANESDLIVDWVRMGPYATSCQFVSRILDAERPVCWRSILGEIDIPTGAAYTLEIRTAFTEDAWSSFVPLSQNPSVLSEDARYIQYRVFLEQSPSGQSPVLKRVGLFFGSSVMGPYEKRIYQPLVFYP